MNKSLNVNSAIGITLVILIAAFPISRYILLSLNGGLTYIFAIPFGAKYKTEPILLSNVITNSILTIIGIIGFYKSNKVWIDITMSLIIMTSCQMLILFILDKLGLKDDLIVLLVSCTISIVVIIITGIVKFKSKIMSEIESK